jgi:hypothetical protein
LVVKWKGEQRAGGKETAPPEPGGARERPYLGAFLAARPEFSILMARIRDRVSTLRALYGSGPLEMDFKAFGERAAQVRMTRCELRHAEADRVSAKTGQRHPLGGFVGEAEYEGDLREFLPYLRAAHWTGVGRHTVWGKGVVEVDLTDAAPGSGTWGGRPAT